MIRTSTEQEKPFNAVYKSNHNVWGAPKCTGLKAYNALEAFQFYSFNGHTRSAVRERKKKHPALRLILYGFTRLFRPQGLCIYTGQSSSSSPPRALS